MFHMIDNSNKFGFFTPSFYSKPASSLVVSLDKALNGTPPPLCGRHVARPGEGWAPPGVLTYDSLHDEHNQNKLVI